MGIKGWAQVNISTHVPKACGSSRGGAKAKSKPKDPEKFVTLKNVLSTYGENTLLLTRDIRTASNDPKWENIKGYLDNAKSIVTETGELIDQLPESIQEFRKDFEIANTKPKYMNELRKTSGFLENVIELLKIYEPQTNALESAMATLARAKSAADAVSPSDTNKKRRK